MDFDRFARELIEFLRTPVGAVFLIVLIFVLLRIAGSGPSKR